jgi:hypothetical protein
MAYNLPPAWDPGFVLPKNVRDEGLERRAFTTRWLPRGTYDDPKVGTGGYVVPQYVTDEGYGQGTYTTRWQPDGTYNGPGIPNWLNQRPKVVKTQALPGGGRQVTIEPLGDIPMPQPFEAYGQKAAAGLLSQVAALPPAQRAPVLKSILDRVDRSIWTRTQEIFSRYVKQGVSPADAFPLALSRSLSTGITAEVINTGLRRTAPQAQSLLGLGCYGCAAVLGAMGDATSDAVGAAYAAALQKLQTGGAGTSQAPAATAPTTTTKEGCTATAGFSFVYTVPGSQIPGHWVRTLPGQPDVPFCPGGPPSGATTVADLPPPEIREHRPVYDFFIGPFGFVNKDLTSKVWSVGEPSATVANWQSTPDIMYISPDPNADIPPQPANSPIRHMDPAVLTWLAGLLTPVKDVNGKTAKMVHYYEKFSNGEAGSFATKTDAAKWFAAMGIGDDTLVRSPVLWNLLMAYLPFAAIKNPISGKNMMLHIGLNKARYSEPWDPKSNPLVLKVWLNLTPSGDFWDRITKSLSNPMILVNPLAAAQATAQVTGASLDLLSTLSCDVLKDDQGKAVASAGAQAVAAYYGIPPQAGKTGVELAAQACGQPPPAPVPPPLLASGSIWPTVLLAGGAIGAVYFLTRKPKKRAP